MGAHFRIKIESCQNYIKLENLLKKEINQKHKSDEFLVFFADSKQKKETILLEDLININKMPKSSNSSSLGLIKSCINNNKKNKINLRILLIIGSESFGIDEKLYTLVNEKLKIKNIIFKINLSNSIESLNCSIAFSIVCYQLKNLFFS
jgi:tRNA G18 (ribose-2'-O)-methylase SpoU